MKKIISIIMALLLVSFACVYVAAEDSACELIYMDIEQKQLDAVESNTALINYFMDCYSAKTRSDFEVEDSFPEYYGGSYINSDGDLVILVTDDTKKEVSSISEVANEPFISECKYSYSDLSDTMDSISNALDTHRKARDGYTDEVICWAIDDKENCIYVYLKTLNDDTVEWFRENIVDSDSITFKQSDNGFSKESTLSGQAISTTQYGLSAAFRVRRSTNEGFKYGFITCAHGNSLEESIYGNDGNYLGTVKLRSFGGAYDVSYVEMNSSDGFSNTISGSPYTLNNTNDDIAYPVYGQYVYLYARYHKGEGGMINSTNLSYNADGVNFSGMIGANYISQKGDSGGLICTSPSNNHCDVVGVHQGTVAPYKVFTAAYKVINLWYLNRY